MAGRERGRNHRLFAASRAAVIGAATFLGMQAMGASPPVLVFTAAAVVAALAGFAPDLGVIGAIIVLSVPLLAAEPVLGVLFLVVGVVAARYSDITEARGFIVISAAVLGTALGPVWAVVALAGAILGSAGGALAAAAACLIIQLIGLLTGSAAIGVVVTGGTEPLLGFAAMPESLLAVGWIPASLRSIDGEAVNRVVTAVSSADHGMALISQPLLSGLGAAIAGYGGRGADRSGKVVPAIIGVVAGCLVLAAGSVAIVRMTGAPISAPTMATQGVLSAALAAAAVVAHHHLFTRKTAAPTDAAPERPNADDADVDELLSLIATAEEKLATEHTSLRTIMITDMKSFSSLAEETGSLLTAKAIQRQRDLLMPVIAKHGGKSKSTGGDGMIAAFESAESALRAAVGGQRALAEYNAAHPTERDILVRMGIADGEVVLDRNGKPFIGTAINLAARVMSLADGGQSFSAGSVVEGVDGVDARSLGTFELKNISQPVEVYELVWQADEAADECSSA